MKKITEKKYLWILLALIAGIAIGKYWRSESAVTTHEHMHHDHTEATWTCSMHPQIRQPAPGQCPICGMDLVPLTSEESQSDPQAISMSPTAIKLADIKTTTVGKMRPAKTIRLSGHVDQNKRQSFTQSIHFPGRLESLQVQYQGEKVHKGNVIATVYSPELITAQQELLEAMQLKHVQPTILQSARRKLQNWKISDEHIETLMQTGTVIKHFPVEAEASGFVEQINVNEGAYMNQGQPIFTVADHTTLWINLDVFEEDLRWIKTGDMVNYQLSSAPGETYKGKISYIDPTINRDTRAAHARIEVNNAGLKLKPGMLVSAEVNTQPENEEMVVVVPKSSVLWTGKRSVVYVKSMDMQGISFTMREITLGPALAEHYVVKSGVDTGEEIAYSGTFSIDAAAQLAGYSSMMQQKTPSVNTGTISLENSANLIDQYLEVKDALAHDEVHAARSAMQNLISAIRLTKVSEQADRQVPQLSRLKRTVEETGSQQTIEALRHNFDVLSREIISLLRLTDPSNKMLYILECPMYQDNTGSRWLSRSKDIENPYYGSAMFRCGSIIDSIQ